MRELHPSEKSLPNYVRIGFEHATGRVIPASLEAVLRGASLLDASILTVDDALDDSMYRAGRLCLHRQVGVMPAVLHAVVMSTQALDAFTEAMTLAGTPVDCQVRIYQVLNSFVQGAYGGAILELELKKLTDFQPLMLEQYLRMIHAITGLHVKAGVECGQLLGGRQPDPVVSQAAEALGVIRQVLDDFDDYFDEHHEPFGDLKAGLNRFPELLFKRMGGSREQVLRALEAGRPQEARALVLNEQVRREMYEFCMEETSRIRVEGVPPALISLVGDIGAILSRRG
ncbi:polyprenyl synthetase family protein [Hyalangium gracile]|uniref:polyprenyl synthetase family protein n=1 Tax=Hyalangium gracile TaxID=394092 RepID=UPI001CCB3698|nr:polyprenyl synthetase family protein [Hyalangium gracile]